MRRSSLTVAALVLILAGKAATAADLPLEDRLAAAAPGADAGVLRLAARAAQCARERGLADETAPLAVIDYSRPSTEPRLWVFDLKHGRLLYQELVAHGRATGELLASRFSNTEGSHMTSLGLFRTADTYVGNNGYSLRLQGLEQGFNDNALARAIVMHGAPYVSAAFAGKVGRIGRSLGCPAVRPEVARSMIDTLKGGALLFAYFPDRKWLTESKLLSCTGAGERLVVNPPGAAPIG